MQISISIVLFNTKKKTYEKLIKAITNSKLDNFLIYIIDNSNKENKNSIFKKSNIIYLHNKKNIGYGSAHNIAIKQTKFPLHLIVNPDIFFSSDSLKKLMRIMEKNPNYSAIMPNIKYPDGRDQDLLRQLPTPLDLITRRFAPNLLKKIYFLKKNRFPNKKDKHMVAPFLSGCFMLCKTASLKKIHGFDERFFLYMEDIDLSRRLFNEGHTIYVPEVTVYHEFKRKSYINLKHLILHVISAIKYFNKWGWIIDRDKNRINNIAQ